MEELFALFVCFVSGLVNLFVIGMLLLISKLKSLNRESEEITLMSRRMHRWEAWKKQKLEEYYRIENETSHQTNRVF